MPQDLSISHMSLRIGIGLVFIWFGIDKFIHPEYWAQVWIPAFVLSFLESLQVTTSVFLVAIGLFEVLLSISLFSGIFIKEFSLVGILFLVSILSSFGPTEVLVRDIGLIGGLGALFFWPERRGGW